MKFLILGSHGMAGHLVSLYLKENGHEVTGFARHALAGIDNIIGDANNLEKLKKIIVSGNYDVIVNCIGILNKNAENHHAQAVFINSFLPHYLADITRNLQTWVIQMSTDCVFSGNSGDYRENSLPDGQLFYDRTKALGELNDEINLTLRNSIVGPDINVEGIGLLNWFMKQNGEVNGYTRAMWTGMTTLQLAKVVEKAAIAHPIGLVNMVPDHNISKYDLLKYFNRYLREGELTINADDSVNVNKTLIRTNFAFDEIVPSYDKMVFEMAEWIRNHKYLYEHYNL